MDTVASAEELVLERMRRGGVVKEGKGRLLISFSMPTDVSQVSYLLQWGHKLHHGLGRDAPNVLGSHLICASAATHPHTLFCAAHSCLPHTPAIPISQRESQTHNAD